jgi:hypothetical protein
MFRLPCYGTHNMTDIVANEREVKTKDGTIVHSDFWLANILDNHDNINDTPFIQQGSRSTSRSSQAFGFSCATSTTVTDIHPRKWIFNRPMISTPKERL